MTVDETIDKAIAGEGDYVNDPADRGGPTRYGITQAVARAQGYSGDMRAFPRDEAVVIYRQLYWLRPGFDKVAMRAPAIAAALFDSAINMGSAVGIGFLQRSLNALNRGASDYPDMPLDGRIGPTTLAALDAFLARRKPDGEAVLLKTIEALRGARYVALTEQRPANETFLYGWLKNRVG